MTPTPDVDAFIARWAASGAAERANFQSFANELCDLLGVAKPLPAGGDAAADAYVFEKPVPLAHGTTGFIDLYRRGCFVMEAKQGSAGAQGSGVQRTAESAAPDAGGLGGGASEAASTDWSLKSAQSAQSADDPSFVETILERLVALNAARAAEEACGVVRWLRPAYQMPRAGAAEPAASQASTRSIAPSTDSGSGNNPTLVDRRTKASRTIQENATVASPDSAPSSQRRDSSWRAASRFTA